MARWQLLVLAVGFGCGGGRGKIADTSPSGAADKPLFAPGGDWQGMMPGGATAIVVLSTRRSMWAPLLDSPSLPADAQEVVARVAETTGQCGLGDKVHRIVVGRYPPGYWVALVQGDYAQPLIVECAEYFVHDSGGSLLPVDVAGTTAYRNSLRRDQGWLAPVARGTALITSSRAALERALDPGTPRLNDDTSVLAVRLQAATPASPLWGAVDGAAGRDDLAPIAALLNDALASLVLGVVAVDVGQNGGIRLQLDLAFPGPSGADGFYRFLVALGEAARGPAGVFLRRSATSRDGAQVSLTIEISASELGALFRAPAG